MAIIELHHKDNLEFLKSEPNEKYDLIYIDPPFNSGKKQKLTSIKAKAVGGEKTNGFAGKTYEKTIVGEKSYVDIFGDKFIEFLKPRLEEAYRVLKPNGSMYLHINQVECHYVKILMDSIFGRENFLNEIIRAWDFGARSKSRWPVKHDTILFYVKDTNNYTWNYDQIDRVPYMSDLAGEEKIKEGKPCTDCFMDLWKNCDSDFMWTGIVGTNSKEKTGYPSQKPIKLLERLIKVSSNENDYVLDFFAGSATTGQACKNLNRNVVLVDNNFEAIQTTKERLGL